jgi:polysaccharide biosynthesis protein PelA
MMTPEPISMQRTRARDASSYAAYYGWEALPALRDFEVVILQPQAFDETAVRALLEANVLPLAYLSMSQQLADAPHASWVREDENGVVMRDPDWDSSLVDPAHPEWREQVLSIARAARSRGFKGLMLDTLDAPDAEDQAALVRLIKTLRTHWHDAVIVMNRGFALLERVVTLVDGVIFESLSTTWKLDSSGEVSYVAVTDAEWFENERMARSMAQYIRPQGLACWALDYASRDAADAEQLRLEARVKAEELGYVSFVTDRALLEL